MLRREVLVETVPRQPSEFAAKQRANHWDSVILACFEPFVIRGSENEVHIHVSNEIDKRWGCFEPAADIIKQPLKRIHRTHRESIYP